MEQNGIFIPDCLCRPRQGECGKRRGYAKFDQNGLIAPALAMDHITHEPLMLAYMNAESLRMTMELGEAVTTTAAARKSGIRAQPAAMCKK